MKSILSMRKKEKDPSVYEDGSAGRYFRDKQVLDELMQKYIKKRY